MKFCWKLAAVSSLSLIAIVISACGKSYPILGTWHPVDGTRTVSEMTMTVTADSMTFVQTNPAANSAEICRASTSIRINDTEVEILQDSASPCMKARKGTILAYGVQGDRLELTEKGPRNADKLVFTKKK